MAENKRTFIFYSDWINMVQEMPNEDAGQLLKHVLGYVNDENPTTDNILVKVVFGHMKPMLKDDLIKWSDIRKRRKGYGKKGGEAKAKQKLAKAKQVEAVNDNVNVNVNVNEEKKEKENELIIYPTFNDFWIMYDKKSGDKRASLKKWDKLDQKIKEYIMIHVVDYVVSTPDKQFRKNPETYLNQKHWQNEILLKDNGRGYNLPTAEKYVEIISGQGD